MRCTATLIICLHVSIIYIWRLLRWSPGGTAALRLSLFGVTYLSGAHRELAAELTGDRDGSSANSFRVRFLPRGAKTARKMQRTQLPSRPPVSSAASSRVRQASKPNKVELAGGRTLIEDCRDGGD